MNDITEHKWSDVNVSSDYNLTTKDGIWLDTDQTGSARLNKDDAIAIAEHFGLIDSAILHGKRNANNFGNYKEVMLDKLNE